MIVGQTGYYILSSSNAYVGFFEFRVDEYAKQVGITLEVANGATVCSTLQCTDNCEAHH
jgi:hypothetical protein